MYFLLLFSSVAFAEMPAQSTGDALTWQSAGAWFEDYRREFVWTPPI